MTIMRVWQADHPDGSPRKCWAVAIVDGRLVTRWSAASQNLCQPVQANQKGATLSALLAAKEREKRNKGYKFLGEMEVTEKGEILHVKPKPPPEKPKGYFTLTVQQIPPEAWTLLEQAGYLVKVSNEMAEIQDPEYKGTVKVNFSGERATCGLEKATITEWQVLAMIHLAKQGKGGVFVDPIGDPYKLSFDGLTEKMGCKITLRDTAEILGLAPKAISKLLKAKSGLFAFSKQLPT